MKILIMLFKSLNIIQNMNKQILAMILQTLTENKWIENKI